MQSDEKSFEHGDGDNCEDIPTRQFTSAFEVAALSEARINQLKPGSSIGRYKIRDRIGAGGFGVVFLAEDGALKREVCIKVSKTPIAADQKKHFSLITEAQAAASLDHPNIVRVFDTGQWEVFPYLVMEYVAGATLGHEIRSTQRISVGRALALMEQVAMALAHLHSRGLIHRDLKPANILISPSDVVKLTDFGLAISDEMPAWNKLQIAGTQRYMAPEQVLGETHRIDGRTDIWGFGVVLYELLTTKPPFRSTDPKTLFQSILKSDAPSLRQRRPDIPHSLDQFCLRCLSQCMSDRYQSATELLEDLAEVKNGLDESHATEHRSTTAGVSHTPHVMRDAIRKDSIGQASDSSSQNAVWTTERHAQTDNATGPTSSESSGIHSDSMRIVPRGLRAFDQEDHGFFLKLIPGPRGAQDIPLTLRFWKNWVASKGGDVAHSVGVLYGPSGSGKSSFIKAGLIPIIRETTTPVYVDFTVNEPIKALLSQLHNIFPTSSSKSDLTSTLASIRNATREKTTVLVLDQFEQYLANTPLNLQHELVQSLRQCDGQRLKAILLVRDEFWNSISQFMHLMESSLADHSNALSLPLLNQRHAERVLEAIGRAYENLPSAPEPVSDSQRSFIEQAVQLLSQDGLVVCVRLAMFAELMRNHEWEPKTLVRLGGVDGAAIKYLNESFDVQTAPISHRSVTQPCRDILRRLLPTRTLDIKSSSKSKEELRLSAGENLSEIAFEHAIKVLETELRLISTVGQNPEGKPLFSLTHDYLVKPVRDWIFEHEESTWQGRARNKLTALAARYDLEPSSRNLPTIAEWFAIQGAAPKNRRSVSEQQVLHAGTRVVMAKLVTISALGILLLSVAWYAMVIREESIASDVRKAQESVDNFLASESNGLVRASQSLHNPSKYIKQEFSKRNYVGEPSPDNRLTLLGSLVQIKVDPQRVIEAVEAADPDTQPVWRDAFAHSQLRESVYQSLKNDSTISPQLHWQFLSNDDFRLLPKIEKSNDPSPIILCHQIVACALEESSPVTWNSSKLEKFVSQKPMDSELQVLTTLMQGLISQRKDVDLDRIERQAKASRASIAMPAQWYLEKSKDAPLDFQPTVSADWKVECPMPGISIPMIRLPAGTVTLKEKKKSRSGQTEEVLVRVVVQDEFWVAQERVDFEQANRFINLRENSGAIEIKKRDGLATFSSLEGLCFFCNLLSSAQGYMPAYEIEKQAPTGVCIELSPGIYWLPQADGFRIPTNSERLYYSSCGDYQSVYEGLYKYRNYFNLSRTRSEPNAPRAAAYSTIPNPWGCSNTMSFPSELFFDTDLDSIAASTFSPDPVRNRNSAPISNGRTENSALRLARGPLLFTPAESVSNANKN